MLSRTRKAFLEARSGFHGNAFKSWGETQLHKPWDGCVELPGRATVFGAEWAEPVPWTESMVWMVWTNTILEEKEENSLRWRQWNGVIVTLPQRQLEQCDPAPARRRSVAVVSHMALLPCVCKNWSCLTSPTALIHLVFSPLLWIPKGSERNPHSTVSAGKYLELL